MAAGMTCIITPTTSTVSAPFCEEGAAAVIDCLAGPLYQVAATASLIAYQGLCTR